MNLLIFFIAVATCYEMSVNNTYLSQFQMSHGFMVAKHLYSGNVFNTEECASLCFNNDECHSFDVRLYDQLCTCNYASASHVGSVYYESPNSEHYEFRNGSIHRRETIHSEWSLTSTLCELASQRLYAVSTNTSQCSSVGPLVFGGNQAVIIPWAFDAHVTREVTVLVAFKTESEFRGWLFSRSMLVNGEFADLDIVHLGLYIDTIEDDLRFVFKATPRGRPVPIDVEFDVAVIRDRMGYDLADGAVHYIAIVKHLDGFIYMYFDGILVGTRMYSGTVDLGEDDFIWVGGRQGSDGSAGFGLYTGTIYDISVMSYSITSEMVALATQAYTCCTTEPTFEPTTKTTEPITTVSTEPITTVSAEPITTVSITLAPCAAQSTASSTNDNVIGFVFAALGGFLCASLLIYLYNQYFYFKIPPEPTENVSFFDNPLYDKPEQEENTGGTAICSYDIDQLQNALVVENPE